MDIIQILYLIFFVLVTAIRKFYTSKFKPEDEQIKEGSAIDRFFLGFVGIAMILPIIKIWIDLIPFADYSGNETIRWIGLVLFAVSGYLLYRSHTDLGRNWNPELAINKEQHLVQTGIYRKIRHPMYTAHLFWAFGNAIIFTNWIIGPLMLLGMIPFLIYRIPKEEKMLTQQFGEEYIQYKTKTRVL